MFNEMSNPMFNNTSFTQCNILFMDPAKEMHPTMLRFYEAMKTIKGVEGQSASAKVLNMSPQKLNNWEARGISAEAAIVVECAIGCRAAWLRNNNGGMLSNSAHQTGESSGDLFDPHTSQTLSIEDAEVVKALASMTPQRAAYWREKVASEARLAILESKIDAPQEPIADQPPPNRDTYDPSQGPQARRQREK